MTNLKTRAIALNTAAALFLAGCANGIPSESNMGYLYSPTVSACRAGGGPNDSCVGADLVRCKGMVDMANPGRDESTYMAVINTVTTIAGGVAGFAAAGVKGAALLHSTEIVGGEVGGQGAGTAFGYNTVLYRSSVEACMYSLGRDPKVTEQYFGMAAYWGPRAVSYDAVQQRLQHPNGVPAVQLTPEQRR